jgi:hypothetical protein
MVINMLLSLAWITAGIVQLVLTCREGWNAQGLSVMLYSDWGCRIAAGVCNEDRPSVMKDIAVGKGID